MGKIEVKENPAKKVTCPHCRERMVIDLLPFQEDPTKIMESKCPYCYKNIYVALTILAHKNLPGLMETLQAMFIAINEVGRANANRNIIDASVSQAKKHGGN